jgi:hypothetical protein
VTPAAHASLVAAVVRPDGSSTSPAWCDPAAAPAGNVATPQSIWIWVKALLHSTAGF